MSEITLESIQAKQSELAEMIAKLTAVPQITRIDIPAATIELRAGEHYAGEILKADGSLDYRLALMSVSDDTHDWAGAGDYAKSLGGKRPNLAERGLLIANCKPHLPASGTFWLDDEYAGDASYAWFCSFSYGRTGGSHKSYEAQAVVVRRF